MKKAKFLLTSTLMGLFVAVGAVQADPSETALEQEFESAQTTQADSRIIFEQGRLSNGGNSKVRKDGLSYETMYNINDNYALFEGKPNPLNEKETRAWRDEASRAQFYYRLQNMAVPKELNDILTRANILHQRSPQTRSPASVSIEKPVVLSDDLHQDACLKKQMKVSPSFYSKYCK